MKNYVIIGASTGIGSALAKQLSAQGDRVYGTYCKNSVSDYGQVSYHYVNVLEEVDDLFLPEKIDGFVYCPGSIDLKPFHRIKTAAFAADFELQVLGAVKWIQAALPSLKRATQASIVLFSTVAVQTGFPFHAQVATSKGAIEGLVKALAAELSPNIRVNAIAPSLTETPLAEKLIKTEEKKAANAARHPLKRIGKAEDIAAAAVYLLSEQSSWVTGQVLAVDGGMSRIKN